MDTTASQTEQLINSLKDSYIAQSLCLLLNPDGSSHRIELKDSLHTIIVPNSRWSGDEYEIEQLLQKGKDSNQQDFVLRNTPLHIAARFDKVDTIELLLKYGADR